MDAWGIPPRKAVRGHRPPASCSIQFPSVLQRFIKPTENTFAIFQRKKQIVKEAIRTEWLCPKSLTCTFYEALHGRNALSKLHGRRAVTFAPGFQQAEGALSFHFPLSTKDAHPDAPALPLGL